MFTQKIVDNMKGRDRAIMRDAMEQFAEPTKVIVKRAVALSMLKGERLIDLS